MRTMRSLLCLAAFVGLPFFCSQPLRSGTEVTNGNVMGRIFNADGTPAGNAVVRFTPDTLNPYLSPDETTDSVVTDENGWYYFDSLRTGFYNLHGRKAGKQCYMDSIFIRQDRSETVANDTLETPGSCTGVVHLQNRTNHGSAIILVLGSNTYAMPQDTLGNFSIPTLAKGKYRFRFLTTLPDYATKDTAISVDSGATTRLQDTILLKYLGIDSVGPVSVSYNARMMSATITWRKLDTQVVAGYNIYPYLSHPQTTPSPLNPVPVTDTSFVADLWGLSADSISFVVSAVRRDTAPGQYVKTEGGFSQSGKILAASPIVGVDTTFIPFQLAPFAYGPIDMIMANKTIIVHTGSGISVFSLDGTQLRSCAFSSDTLWSRADRVAADTRGNTYVYLAKPKQLLRYNSVMSLVNQVAVPSLDSCKVSAGKDGTVYVHGHTPLDYNLEHYATDYAVQVLRYDTSLVEQDSQTVAVMPDGYDIGTLQVSGDTIVASDMSALGDAPEFIRLYDRRMSYIGHWCLDSIPMFGSPQPAWSYEMTSMWKTEIACYKGENGTWALYAKTAYPLQVNTTWVRILSQDRTVIARGLAVGNLLSIDAKGIMYWLVEFGSDYAVCRYQLK